MIDDTITTIPRYFCIEFSVHQGKSTSSQEDISIESWLVNPHRRASLSLLSALGPVTSALFDRATSIPAGTALEVKRIQPWGTRMSLTAVPPFSPFPFEAHRTKLNFRLPRGWPGGSQVENTRLKLLENYKRPELPRMRNCKTWSILERRVAQNTQLNRKPCFAPLILPSSHLFYGIHTDPRLLTFTVETRLLPEINGEQRLQMGILRERGRD